MTNGFWVGASTEYRKALQKSHEEKLAVLSQQMESTESAEEIELLRSQIQENETQHRSAIRGIRDLLF